MGIKRESGPFKAASNNWQSHAGCGFDMNASDCRFAHSCDMFMSFILTLQPLRPEILTPCAGIESRIEKGIGSKTGPGI